MHSNLFSLIMESTAFSGYTTIYLSIPVDGHMGGSHFLSVVKNTVTNIGR